MVQRRRDVPVENTIYRPVWIALATFTLSCGVTEETSARSETTESRTEYTARIAQSVMDTINADPTAASADPESLNGFAEQALARALVESPPVGVSTPDGFFAKYECINTPWQCPHMTRCPGASACVVTNCGVGKCPNCPEGWGNLVIKNWCAYGCMNGSQVTGGAFILHTAPFNIEMGPYCTP
jgi:hypothetical protein